MTALWKRIQTEPALVSGFIAAALALAAAFGLKLSGDQIGTILAIVSAGLALLVRSQVVPLVSVVSAPLPVKIAQTSDAPPAPVVTAPAAVPDPPAAAVARDTIETLPPTPSAG